MDADVVSRVRDAARRSLERTGLVRSRRPVVVAVSGGADSLCLLDALVAVLPNAERRVIVGHVDHKLRPESASDAEHVRSVVTDYGLRCEILTVDVPALAAAEHRGIEEAARLGRYRALRDVKIGLGTPAVATGHTRDDSVETILLHLLRGSGPHGLGGIAVSEHLSQTALGEAQGPGVPRILRVVRPLLEVARADTVQYCVARGIRWLVDETNADPRFLRNRIRHHLLPVLRTYNPGVEQAFDRLSRVTRDEDTFLDKVTVQRSRGLIQRADGQATAELARWRRLPVAVQRRMVRRLAADAGFEEIGFDAVERALAVGAEAGPPRAELGGGLSVERTGDRLVFKTHAQGRGHHDRG